ncbi:hypothetical protein ACO0K0_03560 [Undibacterium sp. SXout11W]|uniref:hypothetical protein n=1 Tax=Undibacterium sp. SXout11W TaxID=3413050 RepID=UPI003BF0CB42
MNDIVFRCGKSFQEVERIFVKNIYSGFLEGVADQKINQHLVQQFVKDVEDSSVNQKPHLFLQKSKSGDECSALPAYACALSLRSNEPANNPNYLMSVATLVWFQHQNPLSDGFEIVDLAKTLCWKDVAKDLNW